MYSASCRNASGRFPVVSPTCTIATNSGENTFGLVRNFYDGLGRYRAGEYAGLHRLQAGAGAADRRATIRRAGA